MKISLLIALLFYVALVESKKGKVKVRTVHSLDKAQFPAGAKIGFSCKIIQVPMFRSHQKRPNIQFESLTIIKYTRISINGHIAFDLICKRDTSTDQGPVVPPEQAEAAAKGVDGAEEAAAKQGGSEPDTSKENTAEEPATTENAKAKDLSKKDKNKSGPGKEGGPAKKQGDVDLTDIDL